MSAGMFESVLSFLDAAGCRHIVLTGGEPTLHPLLPAFIKKARACRMERIAVISNGSGYTNEFLDEVEECRTFLSLNVSLHGATAATHDAITGRGGSYDLLLSGIKRAVARGFDICVQMTLCRANRGEIPEILALLDNLQIGDLLINYCRKPINAIFQEGDFLSVEAFSEEVANGIGSYDGNIAVQVGPLLPLCKLIPAFKTLMNAGRIRLKVGCGMMENQLIVDMNGHFLLCPHLPEVTIGKVDLAADVCVVLGKIDRNTKQQFRRYPRQVCNDCNERKDCVMGGCPLLRLQSGADNPSAK